MAGESDCIFCKIVRREMTANVVHQDEAVTAFKDINPQAPVHILVVPNEHIASTSELRAEHDTLMGRVIRTAAEVAAEQGVAESGYRLVTNCGRDAGQAVWHLHVHVLGGRRMAWPPG